MRRSDEDDRALVVAARAGDQRARDRLVAAYLPLVYNVVGRALDGHADVDDVVQETMLRCLRGLWRPARPGTFRSWLVAIAVRQVRERYRTRAAAPVRATGPRTWRDPGADFADLTILRLELTGQRREVAEATRWLDDGPPRTAVAVVAGGVRRADPRRDRRRARGDAAARRGAGAADEGPARRGPGGGARARARRRAAPTCGCVLTDWDGRPDPLWRKRFARHTRDVRARAPARGRPGRGRPAAGRAGAGAGAGRAGRTGVRGHAGRRRRRRRSPARRCARLAGTSAAVGRRWVAAATATVALTAVAVARRRRGRARRPPPPAAVAGRRRHRPPYRRRRRSEPDRRARRRPPARPSPSTAEARAAEAAGRRRRPRKKGVSTWEFGPIGGRRSTAVGASWYYNWSPTNDQHARTVRRRVRADDLGRGHGDRRARWPRRRPRATVLLGFNEPDLGEQANMTRGAGAGAVAAAGGDRHAAGQPGGGVRRRRPRAAGSTGS